MCGEKKKKKFEGELPLLPSIQFCCFVGVAQQIINSLYFFFHYLLEEDLFYKGLGSSQSNLRIEWEK